MELLFMNLFPDWAPNIHPMLVHFPIAILGIAIFFDFVAFFMPREKRWWTAEATAFLYGVGAVAAIIVYYTGTLAADSVNASAAAEAVMKEHAGWALWTIWFYGIYALARIIVTWRVENHYHLKYHSTFFVLSLVGLFLLFETGDHGAKMVFGYGTGTGQLVENHSSDAMQSQESGFYEKENGTFQWIIGEDAISTLTDHFTFLQGDAGSVNATVDHQGEGHVLTLQNPDFFLVTNSNSYSNMQMQFSVTPSDYKGDIILTHNVHDAQNYAYMALHPDGSAQLGRVVNGKKSTVEKATFDWQEMKNIKLSVSGDHIKGYVNGNQILHAYSDQTGPGAVGLKLDGNGTFAFSKLNVTIVAGEAHEHGEEEGHAHQK